MKRREFQVGEQALAINSSADRAYRVVTIVGPKRRRRALRESDRTWHRITCYIVELNGKKHRCPSRWLMPLDPLPDEVLVERDAKPRRCGRKKARRSDKDSATDERATLIRSC